MIEVLICGAILIFSLIFLYRFISTNPTKVTNNSNGDERGPEWKKVTVRIWQSDYNPHNDRIGPNVGHVSVEFNKMYVSLWPKNEDQRKLSLFFPQNHEMNTLLEDRTAEGSSDVSQAEMAEIIRTQGAGCIREVTINDHTYHQHLKDPDATFYFYTLDIVKMLVKLNQFHCIFKSNNDGVGWCLFGPSLKNPHAHNCASAVWLLLEEGGIGKLLSKWSRNKISSRESSHGAFNSSRGLTESNWQQSSDGSLYSSEMVVSQLIKSPDVLFVWLKNAEDSEKKMAK
jgi:hypothetical protein